MMGAALGTEPSTGRLCTRSRAYDTAFGRHAGHGDALHADAEAAAFIITNMYSRPRFSWPTRYPPRRRGRRTAAPRWGWTLMPSLCSMLTQCTSLRLPSAA